MKRMLWVLWTISMLGSLIYNVLTYFFRSQEDGRYYDAFGRELSIAPVAFRLFFNEDTLWAGFWWFLFGMVWFWGTVAAGAWIAKRDENQVYLSTTP